MDTRIFADMFHICCLRVLHKIHGINYFARASVLKFPTPGPILLTKVPGNSQRLHKYKCRNILWKTRHWSNSILTSADSKETTTRQEVPVQSHLRCMRCFVQFLLQRVATSRKQQPVNHGRSHLHRWRYRFTRHCGAVWNIEEGFNTCLGWKYLHIFLSLLQQWQQIPVVNNSQLFTWLLKLMPLNISRNFYFSFLFWANASCCVCNDE
jgi:hypothetical protein